MGEFFVQSNASLSLKSIKWIGGSSNAPSSKSLVSWPNKLTKPRTYLTYKLKLTQVSINNGHQKRPIYVFDMDAVKAFNVFQLVLQPKA